MVLKMAWRSLLRNRRRSAIAASAIAFGLVLLLILIGTNSDSHTRMAELGVRLGHGHVVLRAVGHDALRPLERVITNPDGIVTRVAGIPSVRHVVPRIHTTGLIAAGGQSVAVTVIGVDPRLEPGASRMADPVARASGRYLATDPPPSGAAPTDAFIGEGVARKLGVASGDRVVLTVAPRGDGPPRSAALRVCGTFHTGLDEVDGFVVQMPLGPTQALLQMPRQVTDVAMLLDSLDDTRAALAAVRQAVTGTGVEAQPWYKDLHELYEALAMDSAMAYAMLAVVFLITALGIFNAFLMSVIERTREFGVLMAIGTSRARLFRNLLVEALLLALAACAIGLVIGLAIHGYLSRVGIDLAAMGEKSPAIGGVVLEGRLRSRLSLSMVASWTTAVVGVVMLSALYPCLRVSKLQPIEAMRHV